MVGASQDLSSATSEEIGNTISREPRRGDRSPGRTGRRRPAMAADVTDRFDGKSLEGDNLARGGTSRGPRRRVTGEPTAGRGSSSRGGNVAGIAQVFGLSRMKRGEPHGRQRDATSPRTARGANRRGGAKPRGRHGTSGLASRSRRLRSLLPNREWTRTVTSREASRKGWSTEGRRAEEPVRAGNLGPTPGEESGVSRAGRQTSAPKWSRREGRWPVSQQCESAAMFRGRPRRSVPAG